MFPEDRGKLGLPGLKQKTLQTALGAALALSQQGAPKARFPHSRLFSRCPSPTSPGTSGHSGTCPQQFRSCRVHPAENFTELSHALDLYAPSWERQIHDSSFGCCTGVTSHPFCPFISSPFARSLNYCISSRLFRKRSLSLWCCSKCHSSVTVLLLSGQFPSLCLLLPQAQ